MIANNDAQETLVTYLKSQAILVAELNSAGEIKENQWQGSSFLYPAIRVKLGIQTRPPNPNCSYSKLTFTILCWTEDMSSKNCDRISGIVNGILHNCGGFVNGHVRYISVLNTSMVDSVREQNQRLWRGENNYSALVQPAP